ncbi:MAG: proton-conducting transporter membrane subunit [Candidatus Margulisbacteria bacterium]|nr:proton-conducting transporter membrane subunit [Candidatus Margulisiibacteriota bacterium]
MILEFSFRFDQFSIFIASSIAIFTLLIGLYALIFMKGNRASGQFLVYFFLNCFFAIGAVLANNLILLLFFWESLLLTMFGMIMVGGRESYKTAIKAFIIIGITDLCMMVGIALTGQLAGTFTMSAISVSTAGLGGFAFIMLMIGALAKAGAMPFHTWIPDAASDAPLPFMALIPGALEKLIGIYFLTRVSLELFKIEPASWASLLLMIVGAVTIIFAVLMALIQKDFKKLLSYHAISQVGYMVLGIGTALPVGIIGGLFHMINNALYKSCLFLTGGAVEKEAGTTDLTKLGGLAWQMPVTFACFVVAALSISGVPPFNGFFSKELVYDGALERGWIFYAVAVAGSFFTAASFLKLGHAAFLGRSDTKSKEAPWPMLLPMVVIAAACIIFGVYNTLPIDRIIAPILGSHALEGHKFSGLPANMFLVLMTLIVLAGAVLNHLYGVKKSGKAIGAADHIHYAPVMHSLYDRAEKKIFDPYEIGMKLANVAARILYGIDRFVDWFYEVFTVRIVLLFTSLIKWAHSGNISTYVIWSLVGSIAVLVMAWR